MVAFGGHGIEEVHRQPCVWNLRLILLLYPQDSNLSTIHIDKGPYCVG